MFVNSLLKNKGTIFSKKFGEQIIDLASASFIIPPSFKYHVITVDKEYIARPDLLSYHLYGSDQYGDLICKINGISNPFELNEGDVLVIPEFDEINRFMFIDTYNNSVDEDITDRPRIKTRKEKRTANEAVTGDTRFKVDETNRVIIY